MEVIKNLLTKFTKYTGSLQSPEQGEAKETSYLVYFLISIITLSYIIPTIIFLSPSGTDAYTHMYNTVRMADSNSLFEFYEKSFKEEQLQYDYPFGLWFFGSIVMKVTGMDVYQLAYVLPLVLSIISVAVYYIYARRLLQSANEAIIACIFLLSMPLVAIGTLNYSTSKFVLVLLIGCIYLSTRRPTLSSVLITGILVFSLGFTHTGTYMFLMFFSISYFILSALIWKKFDTGMYILIVSILFLYVIAVQLFPFVQPQYIDKGRMVLSISESISSSLGLEPISEMGGIFYDRIFVANNLIYVIFWSCLIFVAGKLSLFIHSKFESADYTNPLAIPLIGSIKDISHGIATAPFWLGPVQIFLSVFGIFKLDQKGKCIALSLALSAFYPGALQSGEGTGSLRELYYLYLIIPISAAAGFYYVIRAINRYADSKVKTAAAGVFVLLLILPLLSAPVIGNLYYQPTITGTKNEKENLMWLSTVGNPIEGVPGFAYRERINLYANKLTPPVHSGSEMKRYLKDLKGTYFSEGSEDYIKDLYSFNINYIISSQRVLKEFEVLNETPRIDSNKQLDKIYASNNNFSIYKYVPPPAVVRKPYTGSYGLKFEDVSPEIKDSGSVYLIENEFYKVKLTKASPKITYIGTDVSNILGEGEFYDTVRISWRGAYKDKSVDYELSDLKYPYVSVENNELTYKTVIRDENDTENWATLSVRYTFYEKAIQRVITVSNDWVSLNTDLDMNLVLSSSVFAPVTDFEFNQIEYKDEKERNKKIYPSQDTVVLKDRKFNEIYFNESGPGLFIKYGDLNPYPTKISYKGSTVYEYGSVSMDSTYSLSPGESADMVQYFSVGDKPTATNNVVPYTSILPYVYPESSIPVILTGFSDESDASTYSSNFSSNAYSKFQSRSVKYNEGITSANKSQAWVNPIGYVGLYVKDKFKSPDNQNSDIQNIKALGVNGVAFKSFRYNLDTIKALSDNNILFAQSFTVTAPYEEFFREGLRNPRMAYYKGEKTGVVLIPVTYPTSSVLRPEYDADKVFAQWRETLDSVAEDGGMAVFWWNAMDVGDPEYTDKVMELVDYSKSLGMSFTTPDAVSAHFKSLDKISAQATQGIDFAILNVTNFNREEVKGVTYRMQLPALNYSCPYYAVNGRISRQEMRDGCRLYVSTDLKGGETKEITVDTNIARKDFDLDFSNVYEGNSIITIRDNGGAPVANASVYVDASRYESDDKGKINIFVRRGTHNVLVEKPGFVSGNYEIAVKGRIYKISDLLKQMISRKSGEGNTTAGSENKTV